MPTALVVDDEKGTLEAIQYLLEARGVTCWTATNGADALRLLGERRPDFMLLDIVLKDTQLMETPNDGYGILKRARRLYPEIPVFIITGNDNQLYRDKAAEWGASGYYVKPIDTAVVLEILSGLKKRS